MKANLLLALAILIVIVACCRLLGQEWEDCMANPAQSNTSCAGDNDPDETNYTIPVPETGTRGKANAR